ncbi:DNRLRE domain-containing protein [Candidatus Roizmanbacteria bacterium]|nr:DNRLRE domain-containing protein [Candidatus Roizmanbacteria bacterium]
MKLFFIICIVILFGFFPVFSYAQTPVSKGVSYTPTVKWDTASGVNWDGYETDMQDMQNAGINWVRVALSDVVSSTGVPNANHVNRLDQYNIQPLMVTWAPDTVNGKKDYRDGVDHTTYLNRLTTQAQAMKQRYPNRTMYYEVHNEPNLSIYWNIDGNPASDQTAYEASVQRYINLLRDTNSAIKAGDPTAKVMNGGLSEYNSERWIDAFIKFQGYNHIDIFAYHPYGNTPDRVMNRLKAATDKMATVPAFAAKPIWITEVGFHTNPNGNSGMYVSNEELKADYLLQTFERLKNTSGVELPIFWYDLVENGSTSAGFGLYIKSNSAPYTTTYLPAYTAYKDVWNATFVTILNPSEDTYVNSGSPNTSYGSAAELKVRAASPEQIAYFKFNLNDPELIGTTVSGARLRLTTSSTGASAGSQTVKQVVDSTWSESSINYNNRPAVSSVLDTINAGATWKWYNATIDPAYVQANMGNSVSFAVDSASTDDAIFFSREGSSRPQLVLYHTIVLPTVTPTPSPSSAPTPTRPAPPTVTLDANACVPAGGDSTGSFITFDWVNSPRTITTVEISTMSNYQTKFFKFIQNAAVENPVSTATGPNGFKQNGAPTNLLTIMPDTQYFARVWDGTINSTSRTFSVPACVGSMLPGDVNDDCTVNITDLSRLLARFGMSSGSEDLNGDGTVNIADLSQVLSNFGSSCQ